MNKGANARGMDYMNSLRMYVALLSLLKNDISFFPKHIYVCQFLHKIFKE